MYHPLYPVAQPLVGRPVNVYHVNGRVYCGVLDSVAPHGIYVIQPRALVSGTHDTTSITVADNRSAESTLDLVYSPAAYFGFGALTGLTLGALAGGWYW